MEKTAIDELTDIQSLVDEFSEKYVKRMRIAQEQMWDRYGGRFYNEKDEKTYEETRIKTEFLLELETGIKRVVNYVSVVNHTLTDINKQIENRTKEASTQEEIINKIYEQNRKLISSITNDYKINLK